MIDLSKEMDNIFLGENSPFREQIVYNSGPPIWAQVTRYGTRKASGQGMGGVSFNKYKVEVWVSRTDVPTVKRDADTVKLIKNGVEETYHVSGILYEDAGSYKLGLV